MSVEARFGLKVAPFAPEAGPEFLAETEAQRRALAHLRYGVNQGEGIVVITGDTGIGKTTLVSRLMAGEAHSRKVLSLSGTGLTEKTMDHAILEALTLDHSADMAGDDLGDVLRRHHNQGRFFTLLLDNAEALSDAALERVRQLASLFHEGEALLQISLVGRTPLRSILYRADMEKFRQRIIASYHMPPLTPAEAMAYLAKRIEQAGSSADKVFADSALEVLSAQAGGVPGRINHLADQAMVLADAAGRSLVTADDVNAAAGDRDDRALASNQGTSSSKGADLIFDDDDEPVENKEPDKDDLSGLDLDLGSPTVNGHSSPPPPKAQPGPDQRRYPVSVKELNAAIESLSGPQRPVSPQPETKPQRPPRPRALSPHELMMRGPKAKTSSPPSQPVEKPVPGAQPVASISYRLPPAPAPQGDIWDPAAPLPADDAEKLDQVAVGGLKAEELGDGEVRAMMAAFVTRAVTSLESLRASLETMRAETEHLDQRRRAMREKIGDRIDAIQARLDSLRQE